DSRLKLILDEGKRKIYTAQRSVVETAEALRYFIDNYQVSYLNINEAKIEDIVANAYKKSLMNEDYGVKSTR
ncbi:MAG TPA: hypothetical protein DD789_12585, partial [Firmicutes bacterium]|nr:hypothetical protein [Bacillota bacterium]